MTIWYDFTTTIRNRGRSGIANAEWSIGQALVEHEGADLRCFELVGRHGLVELDPGSRLADVAYATPAAGGPIVANVVPTWRDRARGRLRSSLGRRADPLIRVLSSIYQYPNVIRTKFRGRDWSLPGRSESPARLGDLVTSDDIVISMGADWDGELAQRLSDLKRRTGCSVVTMVYDLVPLTHTHLAFHNDPGLFERYYRALVGVSDVITCISDQSRRDLLAFADAQELPRPRAEVLLLGESLPDDVGRCVRGDFFLCVGTIERRKNLELIYDALRILESEGVDVPLVVVAGAVGWGNDDFLAELRLGTTQASRAMVLLGAVDDDVLDRLYRTAGALLFPSLFEGWGLPIREAAVRGCPMAVGDSPAIRQAAEGFVGATILSSDDAGPWAEYLARRPPAVDPAPTRHWSAVARDLLEIARSSRPAK